MPPALRTLALALLMTVLTAGSARAECTPGPDTDKDCVADADDNCPWFPNADQKDSNFDAVGDVCENDWDSDGTTDFEDNCWDLPNPDQKDIDGDGVGDLCDIDRDGDGYRNDFEASMGTDPDNWDSDGDKVRDSEDCAKTDPTRALGSDCDTTIIGNEPPPPFTPAPDESADPFGDGDDDGRRNGIDNCPTIYNPGQQDIDGDGQGDACDNLIGRDVQLFFIKGGGGPGANCTLFAGQATGNSLSLTALLVLPGFLMTIIRRK